MISSFKFMNYTLDEHSDESEEDSENGCGKQEAVEAVEHATVSGQESSGILDAV